MDLEEIEKTNSKYIVVKGYVQSGKTGFMIEATSFFLSKGFSIIHLLRDRVSDRKQFHSRLSQSIHSKIILKTDKIEDEPTVYLLLSNKKSMYHLWKLMEDSVIPYILFIDEVDYVDSCQTTKKYEIIKYMKEKAVRVFGISATVMDPIGKEELSSDHIILLKAQSNYKGIESIEMIEIDKESSYTAKINSNLFEQDIGLLSFINDFVARKKETYPHICLINICRTKSPCIKAQYDLSLSHPNLLTIVYNSNGISYYDGEMKTSRLTISKFLQYIKDNKNKYPFILIFAGDLAGRCISFVSEDREWHLTDQRLLVSGSCDEPELIQKIRLCGVYNDNLPLRLYTPRKTIEDLQKAYLKQEEIISYLHQHKAECVRTSIQKMEMSKKKFTNRSMVKDKNAEINLIRVDKEVGWDYEKKVEQVEHIETKEQVEQVETKLIETILKIIKGKPTKMSTFLSQLSNRLYTKTDLYDILKKCGYQSPSSILPSYLSKKEKGYGFNQHLFNIKNGMYQIRQELSICWKS